MPKNKIVIFLIIISFIILSFIFYININLCQTKCNCMNECMCPKLCKIILSLLQLDNCPYNDSMNFPILE